MSCLTGGSRHGKIALRCCLSPSIVNSRLYLTAHRGMWDRPFRELYCIGQRNNDIHTIGVVTAFITFVLVLVHDYNPMIDYVSRKGSYPHPRCCIVLKYTIVSLAEVFSLLPAIRQFRSIYRDIPMRGVKCKCIYHQESWHKQRIF